MVTPHPVNKERIELVSCLVYGSRPAAVAHLVEHSTTDLEIKGLNPAVVVEKTLIVMNQGILKGEVSLYRWSPVWLVLNQLYDTLQFLFLFAKHANPSQSNRRSMVQWYFPLQFSLDEHKRIQGVQDQLSTTFTFCFLLPKVWLKMNCTKPYFSYHFCEAWHNNNFIHDPLSGGIKCFGWTDFFLFCFLQLLRNFVHLIYTFLYWLMYDTLLIPSLKLEQ